MDADTELRARAQARVGTVLKGKYHVDSILGVGGMAVVYVVTHRNQKRFALKILHPEISIRADIRQRFLREGYAANSLQHPGAVAVMDDDVDDDGAAFLVMELLEGAAVESVWEAMRRLQPTAVLAIAHQLLDILAAAHAKAIVHRDIKPANLFLQPDGTLKVLDFGIARVKDATAGASATSTGTMLGTPAFMAPEQAMGRTSEIDGSTDVWAVGATMFSLLSGQFVHVGESATHLMVMAATQKARSLASVAGDVPPPVVDLVDRALAFAKADRWPSAAAMREAVANTHAAVCGAPMSRAPLVALMEEHAKHSLVSRAAHAATVSADALPPRSTGMTSEAASGPTLPAPAASFPRAVGGTTSQPVSSSRVEPITGAAPQRRWGRVVVPLVGLAALGAALAVIVPRLSHTNPPVTAAAIPPPPIQSAPASSASTTAPAADTTKTAKLAIYPPTASVEVDGKPAPITDGYVDVTGAAGSMHMVHVTAGKRDNTYPVLLTEAGPVPPKVELSIPPSPIPGAPQKPQPSAPDAAPSASHGNFSRTME